MLKGVFAILCFLIARTPTQLSAQPPVVFEPQVERHEGPPLWISAEAVADAEKIIDLDRIDSLALRLNVEKQRRELGNRLLAEKAGQRPEVATIPLSACVRTTYSTDEDNRGGIGPTATLSDLAANSRSIIRGTIRRVDVGFDGGVPASLLAVDVSGIIKGAAPAATFYVVYPVAHFRVGQLYFCNTHKGFEPSPGDQILLFAYTGAVDRDQLLLGPRLDQMIFQSKDGALYLPPRLSASSELARVRNLDQVIARLKSAFATRLMNGRRAANGYEALAELDSWGLGGNGDGVVDAADAAFQSLWIWTDLSHDGVSQIDELQTLSEAGILRLDLDYRMSRRTDRYGNEFRFLGRAWKQGRPGAVRPVSTWDVFFVVGH